VITITEKATEELKSIQQSQGLAEGQALRLVWQPGMGFGLAIDEVQQDDQVVRSGEDDVLLIGTDIADALDGATIDSEESPEGARLIISKQAA